ncbi:YjiH family protein [Bacillaceae bacterium W0354]
MKRRLFHLNQQVGLFYHLKFIILSIIGIILFMFPVQYEGEPSIPVAIIAGKIDGYLGGYQILIVVIIITITAILTFFFTYINKPKEGTVLHSLFVTTPIWVIIRFVGAFFVLLTYYEVGWSGIYSGDTGGMLLTDLLSFLLTVFLVAGLLLPLLLSFGLLEFIGALFTKIMRPVFTLPGRSTVDNLASWLGDGTIGVLLTNQQYETGYYTKREAAVISTTFSVVSITFTIAVIDHVNLMHMFLPLYGTIVVAGLIAAIIMPRIPPLSRIPDTYIDGRKEKIDESIPSNYNAFSWGYKEAVARAKQSPGIVDYFKIAIKNVLDMWVGVLPVVMAIGTLGLIIAETTPLFTWLGTPFVPILELLQVPEAKAASEAILVGFTDMFLPAIFIESVQNEMTRFIIAALSVVQLIYLSEVGGVILASKIPVNFTKLLIIFLLRTVITLPIIILIAHFIF